MKILISAGPTREKIDLVRFISNRSSGKMGYALAEAAERLGHQVHLVAGPVALPDPVGVSVIHVESAAEMAEAIHAEAENSDMIIMAAAVADYRPKQVFDGKIKKSDGSLSIELERTEDILLSLGAKKHSGQILVGFAAETQNLIAYAQEKMKRKNLDWIVANDVSCSNIGFGSDYNRVTLLGRDGSSFELGPAPKLEIAQLLLHKIIGI